jgi:NhaA family Na+:H+ antiporter
LAHALARALARLRGGRRPADGGQAVREVAAQTGQAAREAVSPLQRLEDALHPWVAFAIMPAFALANAGVEIRAETTTHPLAIAVMSALIIGKPAGIVAGAWLSVRLRLGALPAGTGWSAILGIGVLSGVGFTMSLFVASLALDGTALETVKTGVLMGSAVALAGGWTLLRTRLPRAAGVMETAWAET